MKHKADIQHKADKAMESLDGMARATASAWTYTRVKARLLQEAKKPWERVAAILARPAVAVAGLVVILLVNAFILFKTDTPELAAADENRLQVDSESLIASSSSFDYEKLVQP